jgi:hypothetical protein
MLQARLSLVHRHWLEPWEEFECTTEENKRLRRNLEVVGKTLTRYGISYYTSTDKNEETGLMEMSIWIKADDWDILNLRLIEDIKNEIHSVGSSVLVEQNRKNNLFNNINLTETLSALGLTVKG